MHMVQIHFMLDGVIPVPSVGIKFNHFSQRSLRVLLAQC